MHLWDCSYCPGLGELLLWKSPRFSLWRVERGRIWLHPPHRGLRVGLGVGKEPPSSGARGSL